MRSNEEMAYKIVNRALANVKEKLEPLTYAVNLLTPQALSTEDEHYIVATDGEHLFFNPGQIVSLYRSGSCEMLEYRIVHILLHGILGHFSDCGYVRKKLAWGVMDLSIAQILQKIWPCGIAVPQNLYTIGMGLYHQAAKNKDLAKRVLGARASLIVDPHEFWWDREDAVGCSFVKSSGKEGGKEHGKEDGKEGENVIADRWEQAREYILGGEDSKLSADEVAKRLSRKKSLGWGAESDSGCQRITTDSGECSFREAFKEFLVKKSVSKDQLDFYDPMLYQYGLDLYENVPLIEPADEIDEISLGNMVIAIDTSGSCEEYAAEFLSQIIGIFREIGRGLHFDRIYLMQCDCSIKNVCEFEDVEELNEVKDSMKMYGWGGTSFIPVFNWVDRNLVKVGKNVDCLLYFSDAEGNFPSKAPEYPTFFITPEEAEYPWMPKWVRNVSLNNSGRKRS